MINAFSGKQNRSATSSQFLLATWSKSVMLQTRRLKHNDVYPKNVYFIVKRSPLPRVNWNQNLNQKFLTNFVQPVIPIRQVMQRGDPSNFKEPEKVIKLRWEVIWKVINVRGRDRVRLVLCNFSPLYSRPSSRLTQTTKSLAATD